jgi:hypothetical protein
MQADLDQPVALMGVKTGVSVSSTISPHGSSAFPGAAQISAPFRH